MILNPAILALVGGSAVISFFLIYSAAHGFRIIMRWDISSGSELQLSLEKKTYLISTMMTYALAFQGLSLFLFIYTADSLSSLFTGAMCAAGTLNANQYGYAVFLMKIFTFITSGIWLILNHADNTAYDYPLVRKKYLFLMIIMPVVIAEAVMQSVYFFGLDADVITSCCGSLFSSAQSTETSSVFDLSVRMSQKVFYLSGVSAIAFGIFFIGKARGVYLFSAAGLVWFFISAWSLMHFISPYIYELPTHHCPFCMLKREYGYTGYVYYFASLCGGIFSAGSGILQPFRNIDSLSASVPRIQRRLAAAAVLCIIAYLAVSSYAMMSTGFRMD